MSQQDGSPDDEPPHLPWEKLFPFAFGIALLLFLSAIDRPHWFRIRPISGAASAMSHSAAEGQAPR